MPVSGTLVESLSVQAGELADEALEYGECLSIVGRVSIDVSLKVKSSGFIQLYLHKTETYKPVALVSNNNNLGATFGNCGENWAKIPCYPRRDEWISSS